MIKLAPSILSADFSKLGEELRIIEKAGAHYAHIDVMDGNFVNNITLGMPIIKSLRKVSNLVFDVHLMIDRPERYVEAFAGAGSDIINFHVEACENIPDTIENIKKLGKKVGLTIRPDTDADAVIKYLRQIDLVLVMSVYPGFGGQGFIPDTLTATRKIARYIKDNNLPVELEMDGGISLDNIHEVLGAGANVIVAGSSVYGKQDPGKAVQDFYQKFKEFE